MSLTIRPAQQCQFDVVSLGEVMLRLDPGDSRTRCARSFQVWEGGGEYNVARGLGRVFGRRATVLTSLVDNEVGRLIESLILAGGVDVSNIVWKEFDGIGRAARNGLNFTERGFGVRAAKGTSDRGHTAISQLKPSELDLDELFGSKGVRWLHTGGIYAGLSDQAATTARVVIEKAKEHGTVVSYDLNYRPSLWRSMGGRQRAQEVNRELAQFVDVMIGNEEDFTAALGFAVEGIDDGLTTLPVDSFRAMIKRVRAAYPNLTTIATTLRRVKSASNNEWSALAWSAEEGLVQATQRSLEIFDRVGGGDSFASGLIHSLMDAQPLTTAVEWGAAHGALAMTTPGDTSMATASEVAKLVSVGSARVER